MHFFALRTQKKECWNHPYPCFKQQFKQKQDSNVHKEKQESRVDGFFCRCYNIDNLICNNPKKDCNNLHFQESLCLARQRWNAKSGVVLSGIAYPCVAAGGIRTGATKGIIRSPQHGNPYSGKYIVDAGIIIRLNLKIEEQAKSAT